MKGNLFNKATIIPTNNNKKNLVPTIVKALLKPLPERPKTTINTKIKNATKVDIDGVPIQGSLKLWKENNPGEVVFDSKLEWFMFIQLYNADIQFRVKTNVTLQDAFVFQGKTVQKIEMYPDFWLDDLRCIIDTKGHRTKEFDIKLKMLKMSLVQSGLGDFKILLPSTQKECTDIIWKIKSKQPL